MTGNTYTQLQGAQWNLEECDALQGGVSRV